MNLNRLLRSRVEALCLGFWLAVAGSVHPAPEPRPAFSQGLIATAGDGERSVTWLARTPNFTLLPGESIHPQLKPAFKSEWTGLLKIIRTGKYTIFADATVMVDGTNSQNQPIQLAAGEHELRVVYDRASGATARLQLQWESDHFKREPVPANVLGHRDAPPTASLGDAVDHGRELVDELGCVSCHSSSNRRLKPKIGPGFAAIGLLDRNWLMSSNALERHFGGQAEFTVVSGDADRFRNVAGAIEKAGGGSRGADENAARGSGEKGRELFQSVGCAGCHREAVFPLVAVREKWPRPVLVKYLVNPVAFNPHGRMPSLSLTKAEAGDLAEFLLSKGTRNIQAESGALPDFETGRRTIEESGCVNCHAGVLEGTKWVNRLPAGPLESIHLDRECGSPGRTRFTISKDDWLAIRAYLRSPDVSDAPIQEFERLTKQLNCNACHELNGPAVLSFEANQGPPPLSVAGNKLRASWLGQVLLGQKRVRPWMALRMPQFGESVRPLVNDFPAQAGAEAGEGESVPPPDPVQLAAGIKLLGRGEGGLSCISCHDFHGAKPPGDIHGPDMTEMSARIRGDWMRRWLRDPGRIQPGTAMPSFFSESAGSQGEETIAKIIRVLAAGSNLPMPEGIADDAQQYLLLVKNEPVVLRTFIDGSSPRSIAVGLPGAQNYVFDAENCRLRYVWRGDFLDVKPVWSNRGGGKAKILGTKYFTAADWQPIRIGNPESEPKPKFRGYLLVNGVPEFHYDLDGVSVRELIKSAAPGGGLIQSFEIDHPGRELWFVAGENRQADLVCSKGPFANGRVKVSSGEPVRFDVTITSPVGRP